MKKNRTRRHYLSRNIRGFSWTVTVTAEITLDNTALYAAVSLFELILFIDSGNPCRDVTHRMTHKPNSILL